MSNYLKVIDLLIKENLLGDYDPKNETITMYGVEKSEHTDIKKMINKITKKYTYNILTKDSYSNVKIENII